MLKRKEKLMSNNEEFMLSTIDNPFNPFTDYNAWYSYDLEKGYDSCGLLARIAKISDELTDKDNYEEIENAINEIVAFDPLGIRIKVFKDDLIEPISISKLKELETTIKETNN